MKCATIAVVGRPSAGKSTLINLLCGAKVSITAAVPQTTRNRVRGIKTTGAGQLIFIDTPGYHASERKINLGLLGLVRDTVSEADLVLYVLDSSREPGEEEAGIAGIVAASARPTVAAINKIDLPEAKPERVESFLSNHTPAARVIRVSALSAAGEEALSSALYEEAPEGDPLYPAEYYTDQDPAFRTSEIIREKAIRETRDEVPHCVFVEVADLESREDGEQLWIRAFVCVERESQKGIVVGKGGERIKAIRQSAQKDLQRIFERRVHLDLRVKVNKDWRQNDSVLRRLIH